jgi:surface carbohydrate biosynthesis protein
MPKERYRDPHTTTPVDFLITYEHKARELEAVCLIKTEMERRGYSVGLSNTYHWRRISFAERRKATVVLTPALYNSASLFAFVYRVAGACRKVVNLQWEQVLTNRDESDPAFFQNPKEEARQAVHLCWGEEPRQRLIRAGVSAEGTVVVGPVQMDVLRPEMRGLHASREAMAVRFGLDVEREWMLFISSFTYVNMSAEEFATEVECVGSWLLDFRRISAASQSTILSWLVEACERYPDKIFIYRPHPSETIDAKLADLARRHANFRVIADDSVRQWISCSDRILTWYSTAAAEVYFAGKTCSILRPVPIPIPLDVSFFRDATLVEGRDQFFECLEDGESTFALDRELIRRYFTVDEAVPSFMKICDLLEEVLRTHRYDMPPIGFARRIGYYLHWLRHRTFFVLKEMLASRSRISLSLLPERIRSRIEAHVALMDRMERDRPKNLASTDELEHLTNLINAARQRGMSEETLVGAVPSIADDRAHFARPRGR